MQLGSWMDGAGVALVAAWLGAGILLGVMARPAMARLQAHLAARREEWDPY